MVSSYNRRDSEAASAQARLKELEAQLNSKDALLATAVCEKSSLEACLADLQEQLQEVWLFLPSARARRPPLLTPVCVCVRFCVIPAGCGSRPSQEAARGRDAAPRRFGEPLPEPRGGDGFQEEHLRGGKAARSVEGPPPGAVVMARALPQEVKEARQRYETRLVEVDSGRKLEYDYKLTEGLAQMRAQNEQQIRLYKDSMDSTYQTKVGWGWEGGGGPLGSLPFGFSSF